jgi:hypothetical protein
MSDIGKGIEMGVGLAYVAGKGVVKLASMINRALSPAQPPSSSSAPSSSAPSSSAPSSSAPSSSKDYNYKPSESDLVYLLHDDDESDNTQQYIVGNLTEYGTNCIPLKVYVSVLLRTWETALLLYLPFLYNKDKPDYSQTLILEISPFLLEEKKVIDFVTSNPNLPLDFAGNVNQFFNFIKLLIFFKNDGTLKSYLNMFPNNFTIILVAGVEKVYLRINFKESKVEYYLPPQISAPITFDSKSVGISSNGISKIGSDIIGKIRPIKYQYVDYNSSSVPTFKVRTIYTQFLMAEGVQADFHNFESIGKYSPDMFAFLKWVIENKSHPKNIPILFVSHSGTMRNFLKMLITNLYYNYEDTNHASDYYPSRDFYTLCEGVESKNTWSMRFKYLGYNVTGFRHAQSCDNMYKTLDKPNIIKKYITGQIERNKLGKYTNLSLWGIFSTLIFINANVDVISSFKNLDSQTPSAGLMVLNGMPQQSKDDIIKFGIDKELTCGDVTARFPLSSKTTLPLNVLEIPKETFVDIIPQSTPLYKYLTGNTKQLALNELCTLDNIFYIEFKDCGTSGCNFSVYYCGVIIYLEGVSGMKIDKIDGLLRERKVNININTDIAGRMYVLTLTNVNPGGLVIDKTGEQTINYFFDKDEAPIVFKSSIGKMFTNTTKKIEISDDFQRSVGFLLGFDIVKSEKSDLENYTILYNIIILYSNLLIRQLLTTHLLVTSYQKRMAVTGFNPSRDKTTNFLSTGTDELYGGKKNKKHNKHNKHNNPKK